MESTTGEITWRRVRKFEDEYAFVRKLGSGTFGTCFLVRSLSARKLCVVKALHESLLTEELEQEVDILMNISKLHPSLLTYYDHFAIRSLPEHMTLLCKEKCTHCIVTEYVEGDTLLGLTEKIHRTHDAELEPAFLHSLLLTGLDGLRFLHEEVKIAHRDVKPANILVSPEGRMVFIDFGLSVLLHRKRAPQDDSGTPNYFSPNLIMLAREEERATHLMWFASDIWSLGAALYYLCTGREVAKLHANRERTFEEVLAFQCPPVVYAKNAELNDIVRAMLTVDQHERPTASALLELVTSIRLLRPRLEHTASASSSAYSSSSSSPLYSLPPSSPLSSAPSSSLAHTPHHAYITRRSAAAAAAAAATGGRAAPVPGAGAGGVKATARDARAARAKAKDEDEQEGEKKNRRRALFPKMVEAQGGAATVVEPAAVCTRARTTRKLGGGAAVVVAAAAKAVGREKKYRDHNDSDNEDEGEKEVEDATVVEVHAAAGKLRPRRVLRACSGNINTAAGRAEPVAKRTRHMGAL